jgi:hypothetical protein
LHFHTLVWDIYNIYVKYYTSFYNRRNPRNYTGIINNGVTRSENLTGVMSFADHFGWDISNMPLSDALVEEVQRMANERNDLGGIEECFKKVCKVCRTEFFWRIVKNHWRLLCIFISLTIRRILKQMRCYPFVFISIPVVKFFMLPEKFRGSI